ncbi:MAG: beta-N-acetylglucosaminidase domain-containing protein, partial [Armatimonadetes bacterium]|nr:beta-N-acetylglucosaminidase domain-containing protein [Armatimonadota bacterium]
VDIEDWPCFKLRILPYAAWAGPEYLEWLAENKLNVGGIHYPIGKEWRKLPEDYLNKSDAACRFARETGAIDVIQYLNPYVTYPVSSPAINLLNQADIDELVASFDRFLSSGGRMISLCTDDFFRMTDEEKKRFETHSEAQAFLVNQVYAPLKKKHPRMTMIFCPQWYAGVLQDREKHVEMSEQTKNFSKDLGRHYYYLCSHIPKDILVFWTGARVRSHEVTEEQLNSFTKIAGRKPFYWDNTFYDFHPTSFIENLFDPYPYTNKYPKDLYKYLDRQGVHLNSGYNEVSKVGFLTASDHFWNPAAFDPEKSLKYALDRVAGREAAPLLIEFRDTAVELYKPIRAKERFNEQTSASEVRAKFAHLKQIMARIRRICPNKPLVDELQSHWIGDTEQKVEKLFPEAQK